MRNLASHGTEQDIRDTSASVADELGAIGVPLVAVQPRGEVWSKYEGKLGPFKFRRAWYYWVVNGPVPLAVAEELYADPVGRRDVRVDGYAGNRAPLDSWLVFADASGELVRDPDGKQEADWNRHIADGGHLAEILSAKPRPRFVRDAFTIATSITVETYHIDSEEGLRLFVETIRKHGPDTTHGGAS